MKEDEPLTTKDIERLYAEQKIRIDKDAAELFKILDPFMNRVLEVVMRHQKK